MATINFLFRSTRKSAPLTVRLLFRDKKGKDHTLSAKTKYIVSAEYWKFHNKNSKDASIKSQKVKINADLIVIENYLLQEFNKLTINTINKDWLKNQLELFYNPFTETKQSDLLIDAIQRIIDEAPTRKNGIGGLGLSKSRINSYISLKNIITEYQKQKRFKVKDVDIKFSKDFLIYLLNKKNYQKSYALKKIADLKTVCNDASFYGIETSTQLKKIDSTKPQNENILYLNPKELKQIEDTNLLNEAHINARKWLLLGCNIGQRGGDLLQLNEANFINRNGLEVIELKQQKTGKNVTIPVLEKTKEIIKAGYPYKISIQKFNNYIKDICKLAGIDEMIKGSKILMVDENNNEIPKDNKGNYISKGFKRKIAGTYPKWELMASHVCRRSFCSNLYGILPTPLIMSVSAHSSEKMLLNYIGKDSLDYAQQIADFYTLQALKEKKEPQLNLIKKVANQ
ncbi:site-specific integrase [Xanthomarina sp. F1114]|uniref:tyrosine-type recombinase/integrase n=1 Tax=Xanthomarina sp. F1114 TaxID=2996019 RepID=UPI00225DF290|nr:site-specific integrase [Xanthomarina sp. F1114]MCX7546732.1 site-specific integrase [Xanthomarina sp. F1114]